MEEATLTIRLPISLWEELEREASAANRSPESVVAEILKGWLRRKKIIVEKEIIEGDWLERQSEAFLASPLGQHILARVEKAEEIPIEQVWQALSNDKSSWAVDIIAEREDRI